MEAIRETSAWCEGAARRFISSASCQTFFCHRLAFSLVAAERSEAALCDSTQKTPLYADKRENGNFVCEGVSVVNGAQTFGAIWEFVKSGGSLDPRSRLLVRLIALDKCPPGFSVDVTRATNTQQQIDLKDFVALDPTQHRIAQEMAMEKRIYVFRSGDPVPLREQGCAFDEEATALACASGEVDLAVHASKEPSRLWADIHQEPYTRLFPFNLSVELLWRAVTIQRAVKAAISAVSNQGSRISLIHEVWGSSDRI